MSTILTPSRGVIPGFRLTDWSAEGYAFHLWRTSGASAENIKFYSEYIKEGKDLPCNWDTDTIFLALTARGARLPG
jgi:hypothetical protein